MSSGITRTAEIKNVRGLHARAAAKFCELAQKFSSSITVSKDGMTVGGCSLMALLMLGAGKGSNITLHADGVDAEAALEALTGLVGDRFGEKV
ncbi:MAG: HPr family phosphocarrier protein [Pseudomonadota bacterium]